MTDDIEIITTGDGSHSLLNRALNETYHSVHGARQESVHVFIHQGLEFFATQQRKSVVNIFEVGFGTGLNALVAAMYAKKRLQRLHYTSIETMPLPESTWRQLNHAANEEENRLFVNINLSPWQVDFPIDEFFVLHKINTSLQQADMSAVSPDIIFYDAFAPSKQPELWERDMLEKVCTVLSPGGVFVTYCAKGQVKRDLKSMGLHVETLPGPPGKKEMVRALKI